MTRNIKGEPGGKLINMKASADKLIYVTHGNSKTERYLLRSINALLSQVIHINCGVIPSWHLFCAELHNIGTKLDG